MRIAIMGTGGLGGCIGGLLARSGEEVSLIARGANLKALQAKGLTIKSLDAGEFNLPLKATDEPAEIGQVDLVLFCVKTYDTDAAAQQIQPLIGPDTIVLSVQNGLGSEDKIAAVLGYEHVLGGVSMISAHLDSPGVVTQHADWGLLFGELNGGTSPRTDQLAKTIEAAGIKAVLREDIRLAMWEKFAPIVAFCGVETLTRLPGGPIAACSETRNLVEGMLNEIEAVGIASGVELYKGFAGQMLKATISNAEALPSHRPSMYLDMLVGKRLELDSLNGTLVRLGKEHGVPTPLNFAVYAALKPYADGAPMLPFEEQSSS